MKKRKVNKKIDKVDIIMLVVMALLAILIVGLGIKIASLNAKDKDETASIIIPVIEEGANYAFQVNLNDLKENEDYIFKVTNYKDKEINKNKISYTIKVGNETKSSFKLYKNNKEVDLEENNNVYNLQNNTLKAKSKETDEYKLVVTKKNNVNEDSKLVINVLS